MSNVLIRGMPPGSLPSILLLSNLITHNLQPTLLAGIPVDISLINSSFQILPIYFKLLAFDISFEYLQQIFPEVHMLKVWSFV